MEYPKETEGKNYAGFANRLNNVNKAERKDGKRHQGQHVLNFNNQQQE